MIQTVHEDDLISWYRISEPVRHVSIRDFELEEDDDLSCRGFNSLIWPRSNSTQIGLEPKGTNCRKSRNRIRDLEV